MLPEERAEGLNGAATSGSNCFGLSFCSVFLSKTEEPMSPRIRRLLVALIFTLVLGSGSGAQGWQHLGAVQNVAKLPHGLELTAGSAKLRVTAHRDGVIRVQASPTGAFPKDSSWAVIEPPEPPAVSIEETKEQIRLTAGSMLVLIRKSPLLIDFADASGNVILADEPSLPMAWDGPMIRVWKKMPPNEFYYGLGDKAGPMNRRNRSFTMWNTDAFGWQESTDPLYKAIPFFIGLNKGVAYGIFFDNTYRTSFDFGKEAHDFYSFGSEGGSLDYYYFAGPDPKRIISAYTALVGRSPLPPLWTLGYQQCRYSYYPEARVLEIAKTLRDKKIPADSIYLDIDYQQGYAPFTINRDYFPHFEQMIKDLRSQNFHTILITDLHIKYAPNTGYAPFDSGMKNDVFVKKADGSLYIGEVWPGPSVFPDFTLTRVRDWWGTLYKDFVGMGVTAFWNDMDEPAVFLTPTKTMPLDNLHRFDDGTTLPHTAAHNVFGMLNSRATYEGLRKLLPDERPFVLTRASYSGGNRYAATWTGDNLATWNHLAMSTPTLLSLGISGYTLVGDDIGGFGSTPPADLLTRWYEVGAFNPIYRNHASKDTGNHEPWVNGPEQEAIRRRFIEERYRLLPYLYTGIEEATRTGIPFMRPVFLEYPQADSFYIDDHDFFFGHDFFVSSVVSESIDPHSIQFPPGEWYDYWTSTKYSDKDSLKLHPALDEVPLYVRAGAIVPEQPLVQSTGEKPDGPLQLRVYPGGDCHGSLYQDDGHTFAFQKGNFLRVSYSCKLEVSQITITSHIEQNRFKPWWDSVNVTVYGGQSSPREVHLGTHSLNGWHYDAASHSVSVTVPNGLRDWTLRVLY
jgi:alpha-glucosidase